MGRKGEDFPLRSINDDVKMLESIHADLVSAPCSRYGKGKAVHLEVRSHAERGGDTQFHDSTVPIVAVNVGRLGGELIAVRIRVSAGPWKEKSRSQEPAGKCLLPGNSGCKKFRKDHVPHPAVSCVGGSGSVPETAGKHS